MKQIIVLLNKYFFSCPSRSQPIWRSNERMRLVITSFCSHLTYKKHNEMKHEMTQWKCFVHTHLLFVTIYGLVWNSSVTFKHKMMLVHSNMALVTRHTLSSNVIKHCSAKTVHVDNFTVQLAIIA